MNIFSFSHFTVRFSEEWKVKSEEWRGVSAKRKLVGPSGLEPPTSCLSGTRSNLLSYDPSWLVKWFFTWNGGDDGIRTHDPLLAGQVLSQLSYTPIFMGLLLFLQKILQNWTTNRLLRQNRHFMSHTHCNVWTILHRKEVIQPHLPIRLPCYDLTPIIEPTFDCCLLAVSSQASGVPNFHGLTGGVYKARERIHRGMLIRDY